MFRYFAQTYMALRECLAPTQRLEAQTEVLADLYACIDNLNTRTIELETRIERCRTQAIFRLKLSRSEPTETGRLREKQRARLCVEERRRVQNEHAKALRMAHMLQMQVDGIASTSMDNLIVDTMRAYNTNASRMGMPARTRQVSKLSEALTERQTELCALQEAIASVTIVDGEDDADEMEAQLMQELDALFLEPDAPALAPPTTLRQRAPSKKEEDDDGLLLVALNDRRVDEDAPSSSSTAALAESDTGGSQQKPSDASVELAV